MAIDVVIPRNGGFVQAIVDREDYERVMAASNRWRLSHNGYVIFVVKRHGRLRTFYLHKLIFGDSARHVNGDRLDNRKENLVASLKKRKIESEFVIRGSDYQYELRYGDKFMQSLGPEIWVSVVYNDGKHYRGYTFQGIPEGYGTLTNPHDRTETCGYWSKGVIVDGMISRYHHLGELKGIDLIKKGVVVV